MTYSRPDGDSEITQDDTTLATKGQPCEITMLDTATLLLMAKELLEARQFSTAWLFLDTVAIRLAVPLPMKVGGTLGAIYSRACAEHRRLTLLWALSAHASADRATLLGCPSTKS